MELVSLLSIFVGILLCKGEGLALLLTTGLLARFSALIPAA